MPVLSASTGPRHRSVISTTYTAGGNWGFAPRRRHPRSARAQRISSVEVRDCGKCRRFDVAVFAHYVERLVSAAVPEENAALVALLATISDRRIRRKVQKLLHLGEEAVRALGELDAALYLREDGEEQLQIVSDAVLSHFRRLLEYVVMVAPAAASPDTG